MVLQVKAANEHSLFSINKPINSILNNINKELFCRNQNLTEAIAIRKLYFRMSLVGSCNLSCLFCHNEGAPNGGKIHIDDGIKIMEAAAKVGFTRIQFTGGEPLLHPDITHFISQAKKYFSDTGVTTNGTLLGRVLPSLITSGIDRIHVSLQVEVLNGTGDKLSWCVPTWLESCLTLAEKHSLKIRLNLPVPGNSLALAKDFLQLISKHQCDLKVFAILPEGKEADEDYPLKQLSALVAEENDRRSLLGLKTQVVVRGYIEPSGIRCHKCEAFSRCKEQSHSLRIGADRVLRPCLATRKWDIKLDDKNSLEEQIKRAALLALDYQW